jgi:hypothetical protein
MVFTVATAFGHRRARRAARVMPAESRIGLGTTLLAWRLLGARLIAGGATSRGGAVRVQAAFSPRFLSFLRCELVSRPTGVSRSPSLSSGVACLVRSELMRAAFCVGRLPTLAGNLPLLFAIHGGKSPAAFFCHVPVPLVP